MLRNQAWKISIASPGLWGGGAKHGCVVVVVSFICIDEVHTYYLLCHIPSMQTKELTSVDVSSFLAI
jgi:hypothetical protein